MTPNPSKLPFPEGIVAFTRMFPDEAACEAYLYAVKWPDGFTCPKCGSRKGYEYDGKKVTQCENHHIISLTSGTAMHKSKQPLVTWFWAAYLVSTHTPGISAVQFQKQLQIHRYETAFQLLHKMRSALVDPEREQLKGHIEIDEAFITRKDEEKTTIIGAVEVIIYEEFNKKLGRMQTYERAGRIRLRRLPDKSKESILPFITENIAFGSTLYTDGYQLYPSLQKLGYNVHSHVQGKGKTAVHTNPHFHRMISNLRTWLRGTHHDAVKGKHLQAYLNEFTYRHNRRNHTWSAFNRCLGLGSHVEEWPEYKTLYAAGKEGGWVHPNPRPEESRIEAIAEVLYDEMAAEVKEPRMVEWMAGQREAIMGRVRESVRKAAM